MGTKGPTTGFKVTDPNTGNQQDLGDRYVSKDYLIDVYPNLVPGRTSPGLWVWGIGSRGGLGLNDIVHRSSPTQVGSLTNWKQVSPGSNYAMVAIKTDGTLWSWGGNFNGELGLNDVGVHRSSPVQVGALTNWKTVNFSISPLAIKTDGTLWAWGGNTTGQLGLNDITPRSSPVQVGSLTNWKQVTQTTYTGSLAIKTDGTLWAWGQNVQGQLGLNSTNPNSSPIQVGSLTNWKQVSGGATYSAAIKTDGTLWTWGSNEWGPLGLGDTLHKSSPTQVGSLTNWKLVSAGYDHCLAIKTDGTLWGWGTNTYGQAALPFENLWISKNLYVLTQSSDKIYTANTTGGFSQSTNIGFISGGALWMWGSNLVGALGLNDTVNRSSPTQVGALTNWKQVSSNVDSALPYPTTLATKTDGTLWAWGYNNLGQLCQGDTVHRSSPVQVGTLTNWNTVSVGIGSYGAIKTDGTLWAWGSNVYGQLGLGDRTLRSSPVQVGSLTNWQLVSCGRYYTTAIKTDGTLWAWGYNNLGQLGLNDRSSRSSPVQVGSLTDWKQIACGNGFTAAVKTNGTLWTWGLNTQGQLGLNDTPTLTPRSSPVQVGSLTNWKQVTMGSNHTSAVKTDGTLWAWGQNNQGSFGINNPLLTNYSSPVQVGSLTNWSEVVNSARNTYVLNSSGNLYSTGAGSSGQLGVYLFTNPPISLSPVQIGSLTNWKKIWGSGEYSFAIKTDGTLWAWGHNSSGELGLNTIMDVSSPTQVGTLTNWKTLPDIPGANEIAVISDGYF